MYDCKRNITLIILETEVIQQILKKNITEQTFFKIKKRLFFGLDFVAYNPSRNGDCLIVLPMMKTSQFV